MHHCLQNSIYMSNVFLCIFQIFGIRTSVDTVDQHLGHEKHFFFQAVFHLKRSKCDQHFQYKVQKLCKIHRLVGRLLAFFFPFFNAVWKKRFCRSQTFDQQCIHVKMLNTSCVHIRIDTPIIYAYCQHFHHTQKNITQHTISIKI